MKISIKQWVIIVTVFIGVQEMHGAGFLCRSQSRPFTFRRDKREGEWEKRLSLEDARTTTGLIPGVLVIVAQYLNRFEHVGEMTTRKNFWRAAPQVANLAIEGDILTAVYSNREFSKIELSSGKRLKSGTIKASAAHFRKMDSPAESWWVHEGQVNWQSSSARWRVQTDEASGAVTRMEARGHKIGDGYLFHPNLYGAKNHPRTRIELFENACELSTALSEQELMEAITKDHE